MLSPFCELSPPSFEIKLSYAKLLFLSSSPPFFENETKKISLQKLMDKNILHQKTELKNTQGKLFRPSEKAKSFSPRKFRFARPFLMVTGEIIKCLVPLRPCEQFARDRN